MSDNGIEQNVVIYQTFLGAVLTYNTPLLRVLDQVDESAAYSKWGKKQVCMW